ncbi:Basic-leucine zipper domain [Dillenia turbinata]|uniref:Basic-leucine zipper domain n=1 Tax=Dillenia turbinata TaxID=194707 RepID=A0AAN8VQI6_9MAGN
MAELPTKNPNMAQNWTSFPHQKFPTMEPINMMLPAAAATTIATEHPSWIDKFLDFSSASPGTDKRSISDSIAFLETPLVVLDDNHNSNGGFDRLDDKQFMSMFSDNVAAAHGTPTTLSSSYPSTPSDQNSNIEEKPTLVENQPPPKSEPGELESSRKSEPQQSTPPPSSTTAAATTDPIIDPKRVKRILANRQSAQRSRVRKLQYISELERSVTTLQTEVSALSPRVAFLDHQRLVLNVDNGALKQRIAALAQDKIFKDAHQEALKKEIDRLRQVYHQQNLKRMNSNGGGSNNNSNHVAAAPPPTPDAMGCTNKEQILNLS